MKRFLLVIAAVVISTSAFADAGGPTRKGNKCWAVTDHARGFGFWDHCADTTQGLDVDKHQGRTLKFDRAATPDSGVGNGGDGGGGGGGGGR